MRLFREPRPRASVAVMTDRLPAAVFLALLALLSPACGGGGSDGAHDPVRLADRGAGAGRERPLHDRLQRLAAPDLALRLRHEPARLGRPVTRPEARPARRQPLTAYNWETNASNAGADYRHQNDDYLGGGDVAGEAVRPHVARALAAGASMIVTVPMAGYVSADKAPSGDVNQTPDYLERPLPRVPRREAPRLLLPARHRRPRGLPGRVRGLARVGLPRRAAGPRAHALLLARQRARPLGLDPSPHPPHREADLRGAGPADRGVGGGDQGGGAGGARLRSRQLRLAGLRASPGRARQRRPRLPRLLPRLDAGRRGPRPPAPRGRARPPLVPGGEGRRREDHRGQQRARRWRRPGSRRRALSGTPATPRTAGSRSTRGSGRSGSSRA